MQSEFLNQISVHKNWEPFLTPETRNQILQIEGTVLAGEINPASKNVLRFLEFPLGSAKVIILGQDPYPQPGVATGRAFEVGNLQSWKQPFKNISLKNILRAIYKAYTGKVIKFSGLKEKFDNEFPVLPPDKLFAHWEKEGVLLLNTSFTCSPGKPGSHRKNWEDFTFTLLEFIQNNAEQATWFLWGNQALEATKNLKLQNSIFTMHPMMCYDLPGRDSDFLFGTQNSFEPFIGEIDWTGFKLQKGVKPTATLF